MPQPSELRDAQIAREDGQRQAALGRRVKAIQEGHLSPVLRRWINADIVPMANLLRDVARTYLTGDMGRVAVMLGTPTAELSQREKPLRPIMEWVLRGTSPGREKTKEDDTSYAEDLALSFMGVLIPRLAHSDDCTLSSGIATAADVLRDTVQGQFITSIQGASAMQSIREKRPELWKQRKSLHRIAMQLKAQIQPQLRAEERGEVELETRGSRKVFKVIDYRGDERRIELRRTPDEIDWEVMTLCWNEQDSSATSEYRNVWLAFAMMMLSIAQQTGGWFEVVDKFKLSQGRKRKTKLIVLSEKAHEAVARDVEKWVGSGFVAEPMLLPPEDGDYLTVKHRPVTGQRPPKGLITRPHGSYAWEKGAVALAQSPWTVNAGFIQSLTDGEYSAIPRLADQLKEPHAIMRMAAHRRTGGGEFYLPVNMDFRGRMYYRTPWVNPQGADLAKSLLCFPPSGRENNAQLLDNRESGTYDWAVYHVAGAFGHGLDKMPMAGRLAWWRETYRVDRAHLIEKAEDPYVFASALSLMDTGQWDRIPVQLDGTCNGLQHLSALMADEEAAPHVNLVNADLPSDIYAAVSQRALAAVEADMTPALQRLITARVEFTRSVFKTSVMVLPYGGTIEAIRLSLKAAILEQLGVGEGEVADSVWHRYEADGYGVFRTRPLADHPLFNKDVAELAVLTRKCIAPVIPRAMQTMDTLQKIGKWIGSRGLAWQTGPSSAPLHVIQAKSLSSRKQVTLRGYHLPDVVRRLTLIANTNEVDPRAHRTGIVANFIHSLDAAHLARTIDYFKAMGGGPIGTIHDCVMVRPSEVGIVQKALRGAMVDQYLTRAAHPLYQPVKLIGTEGVASGVIQEYGDWHELAQAAGTTFPEAGTFDVTEVLKSQWFFS